MKSFANRISTHVVREEPKSLSWLINELHQDVGHDHLSHAKRDNYLEQLKTFTRSDETSRPLCNKQGILLLCRHGFDHGTAKTSRTALKCLANVMLLSEETRQIFVDLGYPPRAAELLKHDNREDEFLASRVLFLLTYGTNFDFNTLFDASSNLIDLIVANIVRHAKYFQTSTTRQRMPSVGDAASPGPQLVDHKALEAQRQSVNTALSETLKLLFNLTQFYQDSKPAFSKSFLPILKLLHRLKLPAPPLQPPIIYVINAMLNLDIDHKVMFPHFDSKCNVDRLIQILDLSLRQQQDAALEQSANPTITLIRRIFEIAPKNIRTHLKNLLLPSERDRDQPLGKSDSLSSRLLKLSASPSAPNVSKGIQEMLFEVSDKDVQKFVRNIGYGFASGFLMSHNIDVPRSAFDAWSTHDSIDESNRVQEVGSDEEEETGGKIPGPVNPITGQRRDKEAPEEDDPRTEDDKIREAEKLYTLFERLKATGVVNVENPVHKAAREGKLG